MKIPEIPQSALILTIFAGLVILRAFGIDTWTTAALSIVVGYITGKHIEQQTSKIASFAAVEVLRQNTLTQKCLNTN